MNSRLNLPLINKYIRNPNTFEIFRNQRSEYDFKSVVDRRLEHEANYFFIFLHQYVLGDQFNTYFCVMRPVKWFTNP